MIPRVVPPLTGLSVLVTRPTGQAASLCSRIEKLGGEAIEFPALTIEALEAAPPPNHYDLFVFISINAVKHGIAQVQTILQGRPGARIAAIGKATAAALTDAGMSVDILPQASGGSEALLASANWAATTMQRALIVRGTGGRELLQESLRAASVEVDVLEVYRRVPTCPAADLVAALETRWREQGIGVVTAMSVDTLAALSQILSAEGRELLRATPLLTPSERVSHAARELGFEGECLVSPGAEEDALLGTLAYWRARAR